MHPNAALIKRFYRALQARDAAGMAECYGSGIRFEDPVFTLEGPDAAAMWRMLCERGRDLRIEYSDVRASDTEGSARWQAWYTFSATGRPVHNDIRASFRFQDGKIVEHVDRFDFHRWASQALGLKGVLLGWTPLVRSVVRKNAAKALRSYSVR